MEGVDLFGATDTDLRIGTPGKEAPPPSPLGAGYLILVVRELPGLSQRQLAPRTDASQPNLATLETGNRIPTVRTLMRIADAAGFELVIGLRRPEAPTPDPDVLHAEGPRSARSAQAEPAGRSRGFVVLREPSPFKGPR